MRSTWTASQQERGTILFREYPVRQTADNRSMLVRGIDESCETKSHAHEKLQAWHTKLETSLEVLPSFKTPRHTITLHEATILNDVDGRRPNAAAESFHAKMKNFRALQRGVREGPFVLYRLRRFTAKNMQDGTLAPPKLRLIPKEPHRCNDGARCLCDTCINNLFTLLSSSSGNQ